MFICDDCRLKDYKNCSGLVLSYGPCEVCKKYAICADIHHTQLQRKSVRVDIKGNPIRDKA